MSKIVEKLIRHSAVQVLNGLATAGLNFVVMLAYARHLGPEGFGRFTTSQAQVLTCIILVDLGLTFGLIASLHQTPNPRQLLGVVLRIRMATAALGTLAIAAWSWLTFGSIDVLAQDLAFTPHLFAYGLQYTLTSYWVFRGRLPFTVFANLLGVVAANSVALLMSTRTTSVTTLLISQSWGGLLAALVMAFELKTEANAPLKNETSANWKEALKALWLDVRPAAVAFGCMTLWGKIDQIAASRWLGFSTGGQYGLALRFVAVPILVFNSVQYALFSDLQRLGRDAPAKIATYVGLASKVLVQVGLPVCVMALFAIRAVIPWLLPQYRTAAQILPAYSVAVWSIAAGFTLTGALMGLRRYPEVIRAHLTSLGVFALAVLVLTRIFDLVGLIVAYTLFPVLLTFLSYRSLKATGTLKPGHHPLQPLTLEERNLLRIIGNKFRLTRVSGQEKFE